MDHRTVLPGEILGLNEMQTLQSLITEKGQPTLENSLCGSLLILRLDHNNLFDTSQAA